MTYNFCDEYGQPYVLIREQENRKKTEEKNVLSENVKSFCEIVDTLSTSVGPFGADKAIVSSDGEVIVTNDGSTILKEMDIECTPMGRLITQLSAAQDDEIGDGTTSVVIVAASLLKEAEALAERGMHPLKIIRGYEEALDIALRTIEENSRRLSRDELAEAMVEVAQSTLSSKVVSRDIDNYIRIAIEAVGAVEDSRGLANLELIKVEGETKTGPSELIRGIYIPKEFSHIQMPKKIVDAKIALLACPFEPPKIKIKHDLNVESVEEFQKLSAYEKKVFTDMVASIKQAGANVVLCQWGFDDEANSLLQQAGISAIRWVGAQELEMVAIHCGASIISRFEDLNAEALGTGSATEVGGSIRIENAQKGKAVTILVRGGTSAIIEETKRSIRDVLCAIRNVKKDPKIVEGAGKIDLLCAAAVEKEVPGSIGKAYSKALKALPMALARNMGEDPIEALSRGIADDVWEGAYAKKHQYILAVQTAKSILRIDDVIGL
ncbi:T-complex protein 1 subunit epsilon [Nematocida homosporus]|uniref:T-complex protein 1 subunit epsilon n=1 Tax=Nematocida homosporus TaxID=1912981 RepID=UPI00221F1DC1|nr:T-complex protein 1 subunit epsilon [Nematocida homosporus]KAI5185730.1 T-complex protein 1 subunit epsilon [Nematocida homosporus]